ncbi:hypothetical protein FB45DRAFT_1030037 [Roridomyces roridus]|uniref:Cytochrome P450 n=1 Tax=Roridomyces roridus TaxID=1738132 RepID=A0AAD7BMR0_9AGAR|nr:hypothetical protein FB45DRAFT_1030037 [Roridomyces roridus]
MVNDLMGWDFNLGDEWRIHRRLFNQTFNLKAARRYETHELLASRTLLKHLLHTPEDFSSHFRQMAAELIISFTYGIELQPSNDPYIALAEEAI